MFDGLPAVPRGGKSEIIIFIFVTVESLALFKQKNQSRQFPQIHLFLFLRLVGTKLFAINNAVAISLIIITIIIIIVIITIIIITRKPL